MKVSHYYISILSIEAAMIQTLPTKHLSDSGQQNPRDITAEIHGRLQPPLIFLHSLEPSGHDVSLKIVVIHSNTVKSFAMGLSDGFICQCLIQKLSVCLTPS